MRLTVQHEAGLRFTAHCRSHEVVVELPAQPGAANQGMNPPELFGAALGACIGIYIVRHCQSVGIECSGLQLHVDWSIAENPRRLGEVFVDIDLPNERLDNDQRQGILDAARNCLLSNTLLNTPSLQLHLDTESARAPAAAASQSHPKEH